MELLKYYSDKDTTQIVLFIFIIHKNECQIKLDANFARK